MIEGCISVRKWPLITVWWENNMRISSNLKLNCKLYTRQSAAMANSSITTLDIFYTFSYGQTWAPVYCMFSTESKLIAATPHAWPKSKQFKMSFWGHLNKLILHVFIMVLWIINICVFFFSVSSVRRLNWFCCCCCFSISVFPVGLALFNKLAVVYAKDMPFISHYSQQITISIFCASFKLIVFYLS